MSVNGFFPRSYTAQCGEYLGLLMHRVLTTPCAEECTIIAGERGQGDRLDQLNYHYDVALSVKRRRKEIRAHQAHRQEGSRCAKLVAAKGKACAPRT